MQSKIDKLHAHFDECKQCRENLFFLCSVGDRLIKEIGVEELAEALSDFLTKEDQK